MTQVKLFKDYIKDLKETQGLKSDYAVAQFLGVPRQSMTKVKGGGLLGKEKCLLIARALEIDPIIIIATAEAQKTKNKELKAMWLKLVKEKLKE